MKISTLLFLFGILLMNVVHAYDDQEVEDFCTFESVEELALEELRKLSENLGTEISNVRIGITGGKSTESGKWVKRVYLVYNSYRVVTLSNEKGEEVEMEFDIEEILHREYVSDESGCKFIGGEGLSIGPTANF